MKNLAGDPNCDQVIRDELRRARIDDVEGDRCSGEVAATVTGKLGAFAFRRAWTYWVAEGMLPLEAARELYDDPCGVTDVRVNGNCGCPSPDEGWCVWLDAEGRELLGPDQKAELEHYAAMDAPISKGAVRLLNDPKHVFVADPAAVGRGFIDLYHIDSELGLRLFADAIRRHGLDRLELPTTEVIKCS